MQGEHEIPDEERRSKLKSRLSDLKQARDSMPGETAEAKPNVSHHVTTAKNDIQKAIDKTKGSLEEMPEWDRGLVKDLVLEHAERRGTETERLDNEVMLRFEVGEMGDTTECRYAVGVGSGNEWFLVKSSDDGDWNEVWRN